MRVSNLHSRNIEDLSKQLDSLEADFKPNLAIVFASSRFPFKELPDLFNAKNIKLVGCTSLSEIYDTNISEESVSVMLLEADETAIQYHEENHTGTDAYESGKNLAVKATELFDNPAILVFASGINLDGNSLTNGIHKITGGQIPIFGALASDDFQFIATYTIGNQGISDNGIQALIIDCDKIKVSGASFSGWTELGASHVITKAQKNVVYEINEKPALDEFQKYFDIRNNVTGKTDEYKELLAQFPLKIFREGGRDVIRSIMFSNEKNKSLVLAGAVRQGDNFRFCSAPDLDVLESTVKSFNDFKKTTDDVDCSIMISCGARLAVFGPLLKNEISGIHKLWDKPMIGFFSSGEIGPLDFSKSIYEFQNVTCTLLTLSEIE